MCPGAVPWGRHCGLRGRLGEEVELPPARPDGPALLVGEPSRRGRRHEPAQCCAVLAPRTVWRWPKLPLLRCPGSLPSTVDWVLWPGTRWSGYRLAPVAGCGQRQQNPHTKNHGSQTPRCQCNAVRSTPPAGFDDPERTRAAAATLRPPYTSSSALAPAELSSSHLRRHGRESDQYRKGPAVAGELLHVPADRADQAMPTRGPVQVHQRVRERDDRGGIRRGGACRRPADGGRGLRTVNARSAHHAPFLASGFWDRAARLWSACSRSGLFPAAGFEPANCDQGEPKVADLGQQPVQRGLVSEQAEDDCLLAVAADLQAVEPGGPSAVQDARDADLIPRGPTGGGHLIAPELAGLSGHRLGSRPRLGAPVTACSRRWHR